MESPRDHFYSGSDVKGAKLQAQPRTLVVSDEALLVTRVGARLDRHGLLFTAAVLTQLLWMVLCFARPGSPRIDLQMRVPQMVEDVSLVGYRLGLELSVPSTVLSALSCFLLLHRVNRVLFGAAFWSYECLATVASYLLASSLYLYGQHSVFGQAGVYDAGWQVGDVLATVSGVPVVVIVATTDSLQLHRLAKVCILGTCVACCWCNWVYTQVVVSLWSLEATFLLTFPWNLIGGLYLSSQIIIAMLLGKAIAAYLTGSDFAVVCPRYVRLPPGEEGTWGSEEDDAPSDFCAKESGASTGSRGRRRKDLDFGARDSRASTASRGRKHRPPSTEDFCTWESEGSAGPRGHLREGRAAPAPGCDEPEAPCEPEPERRASGDAAGEGPVRAGAQPPPPPLAAPGAPAGAPSSWARLLGPMRLSAESGDAALRGPLARPAAELEREACDDAGAAEVAALEAELAGIRGEILAARCAREGRAAAEAAARPAAPAAPAAGAAEGPAACRPLRLTKLNLELLQAEAGPGAAAETWARLFAALGARRGGEPEPPPRAASARSAGPPEAGAQSEPGGAASARDARPPPPPPLKASQGQVSPLRTQALSALSLDSLEHAAPPATTTAWSRPGASGAAPAADCPFLLPLADDAWSGGVASGTPGAWALPTDCLQPSPAGETLAADRSEPRDLGGQGGATLSEVSHV